MQLVSGELQPFERSVAAVFCKLAQGILNHGSEATGFGSISFVLAIVGNTVDEEKTEYLQSEILNCKFLLKMMFHRAANLRALHVITDAAVLLADAEPYPIYKLNELFAGSDANLPNDEAVLIGCTFV